MADGQKVPALICALLGENVSPEQIQNAIARAADIGVGESIGTLAHGPGRHNAILARAFAFEQAERLGV